MIPVNKIISSLVRTLPVGLLWLLTIGSQLSLAQLPTATILGRVKDASGAVVPGATLLARNVETKQTRTTVSSEDGSYRLSALPVGIYEIQVEQSGFRKEVRTGLTLAVGQEAVVNFTLEVGSVEQSVEITAEAPLVNTTSGSLSSLVNEERVSDLPLNGRNYIDLALLQPGIVQQKNIGGGGFMIGNWYSSNGAPLRSNLYLLDGANMVNLAGAVAASMAGNSLGVEGIREYRVITNSFSAEYGLTMGSQTILVSKSGTNNFHGSGFEFLRNSVLDARNFFDFTSPRRLPAFNRNQFGGSLGGPLRINKTFLFGVYEGLRERLGATLVGTTIGAGCRGSANSTITNSACPQLGPATPQATLAPVTAPLLSLYPLPNLPDNRFTFPFRQRTDEDFGQVRVDQAFSANDTLFGRYTTEDSRQTLPVNFPQFREGRLSRSQFATLSADHIFSPTLLNTARFSYSRAVTGSDSPSGISGPGLSFIPGREIGVVNIGGITQFGPIVASPIRHVQNIFTWSDDLVYTRGRHSLKFGTLINRYRQLISGEVNGKGLVTFANLSSLLAARPTIFTSLTPGSITTRTYNYTTFGFYAQDDLRITSRFTLTPGLRYEFNTELEEDKGNGTALRDVLRDASLTPGPAFRNPSRHNFSPRLGFAWDLRGDGKTALRGGFGLLYDIANLGSALSVNAQANPPLSSFSTVILPSSFTIPFGFSPQNIGKNIRSLDFHLDQPHMLQYNLTLERQLPFDMALSLAYAGSRGIHLIHHTEGNYTLPQVLPDGRKFFTGTEPRINPNWASIEFVTGGGDSWYNSLQFGLMKRLSRGLQFQSSYTWSKLTDTNQAQFSTGFESTTSSVWLSDPLNRRLDRAPAPFDTTQNWRFNAIYRLPVLSAGAWRDKIVNGWWVSGILSLQTGYPFSPALIANRSRSGVGGGPAAVDRPDLAPGRNNENITKGRSSGCPGVPAGQKLGTPERYFDPCAFTLQPVGFLGTAARNSLRGPGLANLDFSVVKDTALRVLGESGKVEFRAEFFNLLNRANFTTPGNGVVSSNNAAVVFAGAAPVVAGAAPVETPLQTAGRLTSTATTSRQIQFALKVLF